MINFEEELKNFDYILEVDKLEQSIKNDSMTDLIDLLTQIIPNKL